MAQSVRRVAILGGVRTPFCRSNTLYADLTNLDLMTEVLTGLVDRYQLRGAHIDEVVGGAVVTHSKDFNLTREAVLGTALAPSTPGITLSQACGTSLQAAAGIAAKIAAGEIDCGIAVGSDTVSDVPIVFSRRFAQRLVRLRGQKTFMDRLMEFRGFSFGEILPRPPRTTEPRTGLSMGQHCELMAKEWTISRGAQDAWALESHQKAAEAYRSGFMEDLVVPVAGVFRDNTLKTDVELEKLVLLKTAFDKSSHGSLTAGNSTALSDGAACILLASEAWAEAHGLKPQSFLSYSQTIANNFVAGDGLLMAPTVAVSRLLDKAGLRLQDFDFYEIHEAFAAQVLATLKAWEDPEYCEKHVGKAVPLGSIMRKRINVMGSSLAVGHPFAATGARLLGVLSKLLADRGGRGLVSVCTAGGMGVAAILESARERGE